MTSALAYCAQTQPSPGRMTRACRRSCRLGRAVIRKRLILAAMTVLAALALAGAASGAFLQQAKLTMVTNGRTPTWNVTYLLCHVSPGHPVAEISESTYRQGAKARTLDVWSWGKQTLAPPSSGRCAWYRSKTIRSKFPQRAGYVSSVSLEIFDPSGQTITRTFRLHP